MLLLKAILKSFVYSDFQHLESWDYTPTNILTILTFFTHSSVDLYKHLKLLSEIVLDKCIVPKQHIIIQNKVIEKMLHNMETL